MRILIVLAGVLSALAAAAAVMSAPAAVSVRPSAYGRILFDGRGFVLYSFSRDLSGRSRCAGACAAAWPPYLVPTPLHGGLLGTTKRSDGTLQVTVAGRPLYYYVGDRKPGQILCQNVSEYGGFWRVVKPDGTAVR